MSNQYPDDSERTRVFREEETRQIQGQQAYSSAPRQEPRLYSDSTFPPIGGETINMNDSQHRGNLDPMLYQEDQNYPSGAQRQSAPAEPKKERPLNDAPFISGVVATALVGGIAGYIGARLAGAIYNNKTIGIGSIWGDTPQDPITWGVYGLLGALVAGALLWVLINTTPSATTFFGFITGIIVFGGVALSFLNNTEMVGAIGPAILSGGIGFLIISLLLTTASKTRNPKYRGNL